MFLDTGLQIIIGTVPHISAIIVGRFFSGLLSAIPTNVVAGSIEDMYGSENRVWTMFAWGVAANVGLAVGPIYSTYICETIGWYGDARDGVGILLTNAGDGFSGLQPLWN